MSPKPYLGKVKKRQCSILTIMRHMARFAEMGGSGTNSVKKADDVGVMPTK